jgi:hypothetical protein
MLTPADRSVTCSRRGCFASIRSHGDQAAPGRERPGQGDHEHCGRDGGPRPARVAGVPLQQGQQRPGGETGQQADGYHCGRADVLRGGVGTVPGHQLDTG